MLSNRKAMEKDAYKLPPVVSNNDGLPIYFLTGKNYLYQTLFCIRSLSKNSEKDFKYIIVDDGSLDTVFIEMINTRLPGAEIVTQKNININLQNSLPTKLFPYLNEKRTVYPHIKKLTDIHTIPGNDWKIVLDSDMLFWSEPKEIINWISTPQEPLHMVDSGEAYGYSAELMSRLANSVIAPLINVGAIGLNSKTIDWNKLETWAKTLEAQEGTSYYLEQALTAMLIGNSKATVLPANKYIVNPDKEMTTASVGVLHHYVDLSKKEYYNQAWKKIL